MLDRPKSATREDNVAWRFGSLQRLRSSGKFPLRTLPVRDTKTFCRFRLPDFGRMQTDLWAASENPSIAAKAHTCSLSRLMRLRMVSTLFAVRKWNLLEFRPVSHVSSRLRRSLFGELRHFGDSSLPFRDQDDSRRRTILTIHVPVRSTFSHVEQRKRAIYRHAPESTLTCFSERFYYVSLRRLLIRSRSMPIDEKIVEAILEGRTMQRGTDWSLLDDWERGNGETQISVWSG